MSCRDNDNGSNLLQMEEMLMRLPNIVNKILSKKAQELLKKQTGIENNIQITELNFTRGNGKTRVFASGVADLDINFNDIIELLMKQK